MLQDDMKPELLEKYSNNCKYKILDGCASFALDLSEICRKVVRSDHASFYRVVNSDEVFNRGNRRGDIILVTGDRPRFAIMTTFEEDNFNPDLIKLGDGRIRIRTEAYEGWLDEFDTIYTEFLPYGTVYRLSSGKLKGIEFELIVSQAYDVGLVARLNIRCLEKSKATIDIEIVYGGISRHGRTYSAAYFDPSKDKADGNVIASKGESVILSDSDIPVKVHIITEPNIKPEISDKKLFYRHSITIGKNKSALFYFVAMKDRNTDGLTVKDMEGLLFESRKYYDSLLSPYSIKTPSRVLDSAFTAGILNLEYCFSKYAWLEGVHWWAAYWTNNFQISAAVALGQIERARNALIFFANVETGPCPIVKSNGRPYLDDVMNTEEGLPYYIYQLVQYFEHTGDIETVKGIWTKMREAVERMLKNRDNNCNGLIDWHFSCNAFLYQADHMNLPGDASSPSIMVASMLDRLSKVAKKIGMQDDSERWRNISSDIFMKLMESMWNEEAGVFYNHIDNQGIKHMAHYYTDFIFPALYTDLSDDVCSRSLDYLCNNIAYETENRRLLMRVGNLKPTIFGNDNVMPTQMSEAARAFFRQGDNETGFRLLESVAYAGTIDTEAPGNFPERMNDYGKGEANYIFGNPAGSFTYSVVSGLFGISLTDGGSTIRLQPGLPYEWENAELALPYAKLNYRKENKGESKMLIYRVESETPRNLDFVFTADVGKILSIKHDGIPLKYVISNIYGVKKIEVNTHGNKLHEITIEFIPLGQKPVRAFKTLITPHYNNELLIDMESNELLTYKTLDISRLLNTDKIRVISAWRKTENGIDISHLADGEGYIHTPAGAIKASFSEKDRKYAAMALLEKSRTEPYTGRTISSDWPESLNVQVGVHCRKIALLYFSESESRQTGISVGGISLCYDDGSEETIPLEIGKNMKAFFSHFDVETIPVRVSETDSINLLLIDCCPKKLLERIQIGIKLPDVQFALIGAGYIPE